MTIWIAANPNPPGSHLLTQIQLYVSQRAQGAAWWRAVWLTLRDVPLLRAGPQHDSSDLGVRTRSDLFVLSSRADSPLPSLQPVAATISSPHLTIASLLNIRADFISPETNVTLISIQGVITQSFIITFDDPTTISAPPPERHVLAKVGPAAKPRPFASRTATESIAEDSASTSTSPNMSSDTSPALSSTTTASSLASRSMSRSASASGSGSGSGSRSDSRSVSRTRSSEAVPQSPTLPGARKGDCQGGPKYPGVLGEEVEGDAKPLKQLVPGEEWTYSRVCRVPDDDHVRPTTLEASDGRIRASHTISVEIKYRVDGEEKEKVLRLTKPVTITSVRPD